MDVCAHGFDTLHPVFAEAVFHGKAEVRDFLQGKAREVGGDGVDGKDIRAGIIGLLPGDDVEVQKFHSRYDFEKKVQHIKIAHFTGNAVK